MVMKRKHRFVITKYIDALGTIFLFERAYYKDIVLDVQFLSHPFLDVDYVFLVTYHLNGTILLLPESRKDAVKNFLACHDSINQLKKWNEARELIVIYPYADILEMLQNIYKNI
jgi:lipid A disaccharide synthetase